MESLNPGQGHSGYKACPGNTGCEMGKYPGGDTRPPQGTMQVYSHQSTYQHVLERCEDTGEPEEHPEGCRENMIGNTEKSPSSGLNQESGNCDVAMLGFKCM